MNELSKPQVQSALQRFARARAIAASEASLPFALRCTADEFSGACDDGARAALAGLNLQHVRTVRPIYFGNCVRALFEYPADRCPPSIEEKERRVDFLQIGIKATPGAGPTWYVGIRPASGSEIDEIELQHSYVSAGPPPPPPPVS